MIKCHIHVSKCLGFNSLCRINDKYVCIDGPVFKFSEHKTLID